MAEDRYVGAPPVGSEGWSEVWRDDKRYRPGGLLQRVLSAFIRRGGAADRDRQRDFNLALLELLRGLREDAAAIRRDLRGDLENIQKDMRHADQEIAGDVAHLRELLPISAKRNDALIAALDQKIETLAVRIRDLLNPAVPLPALPPAASEDLTYRRLEDALRGSPALTRESMEPYADLAASHQPVLDVGCGRGEFLELCRQRGIDAKGADTNERSVADLVARGLSASLAGVPECFTGAGAGSLGMVLAAHVVEHLPVSLLFALYAESARVLRSGGLLVIETPNAESILAAASEFWRDPTHLAPRHPAALTVLAREHGFAVQEARPIHPFPPGTQLDVSDTDPPAVRRIAEVINERVFGPQDFRLVLRKN